MVTEMLSFEVEYFRLCSAIDLIRWRSELGAGRVNRGKLIATRRDASS